MSRVLRCLLLVGLWMLSGCGPAVTGRHEGEPLLTLRGQLTLAPGVAVTSPVHLALVWYPDLGPDGLSLPREIFSEALTYEGQFPQAFTFPLYRPPSREVRQAAEKAPGSDFAVGNLVAYEDLDGDGRLTVGQGGLVVDRVLGSTAGAGAFDFYSSARRDVVLWARDAQAFDVAGLAPGYNLVRFEDPLAGPRLEPLDAVLPLELTAEPRLRLMLCPEAYGDAVEFACGVRAWDVPETFGSVTRSDQGFDATLQIHAASARVWFNDVELGSPMPNDGWVNFFAFGPEAASLREGPNEVRIEAAGYEPLVRRFTVPHAVVLRSPSPGAEVKRGSVLDVEWALPTGATRSSLLATAGGAQDLLFNQLVAESRARVAIPLVEGPLTLVVSAFDELRLGRVSITGVSTTQAEFPLVP